MTSQSWFDPDVVFKHVDDYISLVGTPYETLCVSLQDRFDAELRTDEGRARLAMLAEDLRPHLTRFDDPELADRISGGFHQVFFLEQLLLTLSLSRPEFFDTIVRLEGLDEALRAASNGAVFVQPHMGPHFVTHLLLSKLGIPAFGAGAISGPMAGGLIRMCDVHGIDRREADAVDFTLDFKQNLMRLLATGRCITLYPEYSRSPRLGSTTTSFLDHPVHVPTGITRLSQGFRVPMIGVRLRREAPYRYTLVFGPIWQPPHDEAGISEAMCRIFSWVEEVVLEDRTSWEGWRYFGRMKDNAVKILLKRFAESRTRPSAGPAT